MYNLITPEALKTFSEWAKHNLHPDYPCNKPICLISKSKTIQHKISNHKLLPEITLIIKIPDYYELDNCYYEDGWPYILAEDPTKTWYFVKNGSVIIENTPKYFFIKELTLIPLNQFNRGFSNEELFRLTSKDAL